MSNLRIRVKPRRTARQRRSIWMAGNVSVCGSCTAHFGVGYGPLEGARLGAVVRYHRAHGHLDTWDEYGNRRNLNYTSVTTNTATNYVR